MKRTLTGNRRLVDVPDGAQAIYHGRIHIGWTFRDGKAFAAISHDRTTIGIFDTLLQARNAVWIGR
jgi:hypothetical protein